MTGSDLTDRTRTVRRQGGGQDTDRSVSQLTSDGHGPTAVTGHYREKRHLTNLQPSVDTLYYFQRDCFSRVI
jgi:hypothetical protein